MKYKVIRYLALLSLLLSFAETGFAFPADDSDWIPIYKDADFMGDPDSDANPKSVNFIGNTSFPAAYTYTDGAYINYRIRLDDDPVQSPGLKAFGWGLLINTDSDPGTYEYMVMIDGIGDEYLRIGENTIQSTYDSPSDHTENDLYLESLVNGTNYQVSIATDGSNFNGDSDYFLDFRFPFESFLAFTGLTESSIISYFIGTSVNTTSMTKDLGADLLSDGFSEPVVTTGVRPETGDVRFVFSNVSSANWNDDAIEAYPGENIYIRVEDGDQNSIGSEAETVTVTITTANGDSETVTLRETGDDTGIFTGYIFTSTDAVNTADGTLQVEAIETATVTYIDAADADFNNDQPRTDAILIKPSTDIALTKTLSDPTPYVNYTMTYSLKVTNNGPSYSSGAQVYDMLPTGADYISDDGSGQYNDSTGIWYVPLLFANNSTTLNIKALVTGAETTVTNFANITSVSQLDSNSTNDRDSATFSVGGVDLDLTKSVVGDSTPVLGQVVQFLLNLINLGDNSATSVEVTDHLPPYLSYSSHSASSGSYNSGTGLWSIPVLGNTSSVTLNIFANVTGGSGTSITNFANISTFGEEDPDTSNNSSNTTVYVGGTDISVSKVITSPAGDPNEGDVVRYTITAANSADGAVTNLLIEDVLPAFVTYSTSNPSVGTFRNASGIWDIGPLAASGTGTLTLDVIVDSGSSGQSVSNTASKLSMDQLDTDTTNDSSTVSFTVQSADVEIDKTVDNPAANSGDPVVYTITATNNGPSDSTNVVVTDQLPAGIKFSSYSTSAAFGAYSSSSGVWLTGDVNSGTSAILTIFANVTTNLSTSTTFYNTAYYTGSDQSDPVTMNNSDLATVVSLSTDMEVFKTVDNASPAESGFVNYRIMVVNNGPTNATSVIVSDILPAGVTYSSYSSTQGTYKTTGQTANQWEAGSVFVNASAIMTLTAQVDTGTTGQTISNTASMFSVDQGDFDNTNNSDSVSIVVGSTDISVAKFVNFTTATLGDTLNYTITASNVGFNNASSIKIEDQLPGGVTFTSYSSTQGTFNNTSSFWYAGEIAASGSESLTIFATVDSNSCGWTLNNTASLYSLNVTDPNSSNNSETVSTSVKCADVQVVKIADDATPDEGTNIIYTISLTNNGPYDATGMGLTDILDPDLTFVSYSSTQGTLAFSNSTGIWTAGSIAKLATASIFITATVGSGTGGTNIPNAGTISSADLSDPTTGNDSSTITITPNARPYLSVMKVVSVFSDPVNGTTSPIAIPGAAMQYIVYVTNTGGGAADDGSVIIIDPIPSDTELYIGDLAAQAGEDGGTGPVRFKDGAGATASGFSGGPPPFALAYLDAGDNPVVPNDPDTDNYVSNVAKIKLTFSGPLNGSDGTNHPTFQVRFWVRVK